ncbi:succinate dehydrogenase / fumarate reductase iron-sulfur subunit [Desulfonispora thiosulfatigenes DSM 11270]|uniref:succinate dehydrogenase n=1 Tax=Desulfonispora thiosulfatigenes DSM 11270 TaxID=656914 RepID=A0A1W1V3I8_DESTI|nr:succinate dehydrogenase/fumarate reductase iron-sulfur subunit [Desulfonispora thiosulfatigenes]SMB87611.1 succinate dehydrogenase / fumarate reductase iron-sulfur subunit [Desulfonispora thiosulfatigenes DSM 11270]
MKNIIYKIRRYDGEKEWDQEYKIPYEKGKTVLWGLINIRETQDNTLNFTSACRSAICGSCGVIVNGVAVLACKTSIDEFLNTFKTDTLYIEPLKNFNIVRDLVVDWDPKFERLKGVKPWLVKNNNDSSSHEQSAVDFLKISNPTDCILCGICASECGQLSINIKGFLDPFIYSKAYRYIEDSRDEEEGEHLDYALDVGLWKCIKCMQCMAKCPKAVKPADHISGLRKKSMDMGYLKNTGARHAYAFFNDIKRDGRLNETTLPIKTDGLFYNIKRVPFALRLLRKGKIKIAIPKPVIGIEGVKKIYELARKEGN